MCRKKWNRTTRRMFDDSEMFVTVGDMGCHCHGNKHIQVIIQLSQKAESLWQLKEKPYKIISQENCQFEDCEINYSAQISMQFEASKEDKSTIRRLLLPVMFLVWCLIELVQCPIFTLCTGTTCSDHKAKPHTWVHWHWCISCCSPGTCKVSHWCADVCAISGGQTVWTWQDKGRMRKVSGLSAAGGESSGWRWNWTSSYICHTDGASLLQRNTHMNKWHSRIELRAYFP
jgi:hypothetical protein